jgi:pimeloyl-ACP methyl ester carboxylesterase
LLASLAERSRRAVAIDLPGFGAADRLTCSSVLPHLDAVTVAFVRQFGRHEPVVVAGNSMGGMLALRAAQRRDLPVLAVAGIAPGGLAYSGGLERAVDRVRALQPLLDAARWAPVPPYLIRTALAYLYDTRLAHGGIDHSLARRYASHYHGMRDIHRLIRMMLTLSEELDSDPLVLEQITVPVALVMGARDHLVPQAAAHILLESLPHAEITVFDDCGHCPQVQRPDDVAALLAALPALVP